MSEEWIVLSRSIEGDELVRAGDRIGPASWGVSIMQKSEAKRHERRPTVVLRFAVRAGGVGCVEFRIVSEPGDRMIRASDIAMIEPDAWAVDSWLHFSKPAGERGERLARGVLADAIDDTDKGRVSDVREAARIYLDRDGRKRDKRHAERVRQGLGLSSIETANRRIRAARDVGLIPPRGASEIEIEAARQRLAEGESDEQAR
ncbi:MAG: hypothetical protein DI566_13195 [Microbacterium sp.]|nr:MAG: hypothetical protein DI566_13195 [Microbacterium sp.]